MKRKKIEHIDIHSMYFKEGRYTYTDWDQSLRVDNKILMNIILFCIRMARMKNYKKNKEWEKKKEIFKGFKHYL